MTKEKTAGEEPKIKHHRITLPKGGGAIGGIGEKFEANAVTGTATFSVPIPLSSSRWGFEPKLLLTYDSGGGNSVFGLGWNLDIPSISRKTAKGLPKYLDNQESDVFLLSGVEDLVPVLDDAGSAIENDILVNEVAYKRRLYRPRIEGLYAQIEKLAAVENKEVFWRATTKENVTSIYGQSSAHRVADPSFNVDGKNTRHVFKWLLERTYDAKGNEIVYKYRREDLSGVEPSSFERHRLNKRSLFSGAHIERISYGPKTPSPNSQDPSDYHFSVMFDYGQLEDNNGALAISTNDSWACVIN